MESTSPSSASPASLREARAGIFTQEQLAVLMQVTRAAVVAWEAGQRPGGPARILLSQLLGQPQHVVESWWPVSERKAA